MAIAVSIRVARNVRRRGAVSITPNRADAMGGWATKEKAVREAHTFSCRRCLSSFSSRYVRLASTGVLKGFIIFLTATFWLVSWSRAELYLAGEGKVAN